MTRRCIDACRENFLFLWTSFDAKTTRNCLNSSFLWGSKNFVHNVLISLNSLKNPRWAILDHYVLIILTSLSENPIEWMTPYLFLSMKYIKTVFIYFIAPYANQMAFPENGRYTAQTGVFVSGNIIFRYLGGTILRGYYFSGWKEF